MRLLGGYDPYVAQPDRESLVGANGALRKRLFPSVGRPGVVLADGVLAGLWRGHKKGDVLEVSVEWLARAGRHRRGGLGDRAAARLRAARVV